MQEGLGPIVDRSKEHLGPADKAIIVTRSMLLQAADVVAAGGDTIGTSTSYYDVRAGEVTLPTSDDWRSALRPVMFPSATNASGLKKTATGQSRKKVLEGADRSESRI